MTVHLSDIDHKIIRRLALYGRYYALCYVEGRFKRLSKAEAAGVVRDMDRPVPIKWRRYQPISSASTETSPGS